MTHGDAPAEAEATQAAVATQPAVSPDPPRPALTARDVASVVRDDGRELLVTTGRLLARYWYVLLAVAALGATARSWVLELAVLVSERSATAGLAVFALSPGIAFATAVGMLAVTARLTGARGGASRRRWPRSRAPCSCTWCCTSRAASSRRSAAATSAP
ncbi:hypothetical protein C8046_14000 [Serinibacter arcticus]|uniref:Uncharacterized protein n=1 Tax=Serinibacter arcticus TaxID=1655435 RepID=A0A2U1ZX89_9MICO|nr:hypothetical protein [Serinibacter arcticus]PWD51591.1 hypothetical protein C8046_14000 [Serinibacter arcticus]